MGRAAMWVLSAVVMMSAGPPIVAQQKFPPDTFVNLQIFPKDVTATVLVTAMKNFTRDLDVQCQFCHVGEEGMPLDQFDFVADTKPAKQTARMMMRMAGEINGQITKAMPDAPGMGYQVTCFTCHRGALHPQHAPGAPKAPGV